MTPIDVLYQRAETAPMKVAFSRDGEIWTYERLAAEVDHLAHGLVKRGLRKGDRVALHMANLPEFIVAYHACFRTGVIAAPLNIRLKTAELTPLLQRLQPTLYIGQAALYDRVASIDSSILAANSRFVVDGEYRVQTSETMIDLASIRLMLKRPCVRLFEHPLKHLAKRVGLLNADAAGLTAGHGVIVRLDCTKRSGKIQLCFANKLDFVGDRRECPQLSLLPGALRA